jgi:cold shock CspA family protein
VTGTIKALQQTFGFIRADDGQDYFFHRSDVEDRLFPTLIEGHDRVVFEPMIPQPERGPRALRVALSTDGGDAVK